MDGAILATLLKNIRPVQILMLTGNTGLTVKPTSVDLLLPKPQEPEALLALYRPTASISRLISDHFFYLLDKTNWFPSQSLKIADVPQCSAFAGWTNSTPFALKSS